MMMLTEQLKTNLPNLPRAMRQVIGVLLENPSTCLNLPVDEWARLAQVSTPTILRTAERFGFEGVREFRLALAKDQTFSQGHFHRAINDSDAPNDIIKKIISSSIASLIDLEQQLDLTTLIRVVDLLVNAKRVDCYSVGATSNFLANDLQTKLFRLGLSANSFADAHWQLVSAASLGKKGVAVAISYIGKMPHLLEAVSLAKSQGTKIIGLTQPNTPLAKLCDEVIAISVPEDAIAPVGTESYLCYLLTIEIIMVLAAKQMGNESLQQMTKFKLLLEKNGLDGNKHPTISWLWSNKDAKGSN